MRPTLWLIVVAAPLSPAAGACDGLPPGVIALDGRSAPPLRLADSDGRLTDLVDLRGNWVMVHFWASWCAPCRREMPTIQEMARKLVPARLHLVLVNTAETDDQVFEFLTIVAPDLTSLMDRDGKVTERWQPRGLPASFLVGPRGGLRYLVLGGRKWNSPAYLQFLRSLENPPTAEPFVFPEHQG